MSKIAEIRADPYLEEMYYKNKYGKEVDVGLARMYDEAKVNSMLEGKNGKD